MDMKDVVKGVGTTSFIATRVVGIVGLGLIAVALASGIKNRLNSSDEIEIEIKTEKTEE